MALKFSLLCLLLAAPAAAQPIQRAGAPATLYTDASSGMTFPAQVGGFRRISLTRGPAPGDMHAFYMHAGEGGRMSARAFLTDLKSLRLAQPCATHEDLSRVSAQMAHPGRLRPKPVPPLPGFAGMTGTGFSQSWSEPDGARLSDTLHYCRNDGRWAVEYQFFYPARLKGAAALQAAFLRGFAWRVAR